MNNNRTTAGEWVGGVILLLIICLFYPPLFLIVLGMGLIALFLWPIGCCIDALLNWGQRRRDKQIAPLVKDTFPEDWSREDQRV